METDYHKPHAFCIRKKARRLRQPLNIVLGGMTKDSAINKEEIESGSRSRGFEVTFLLGLIAFIVSAIWFSGYIATDREEAVESEAVDFIEALGNSSFDPKQYFDPSIVAHEDWLASESAFIQCANRFGKLIDFAYANFSHSSATIPNKASSRSDVFIAHPTYEKSEVSLKLEYISHDSGQFLLQRVELMSGCASDARVVLGL
ncbi:MAG: hypothetical protein RJQ07_04490 [Pseudomonadales bacterium]